MGHAGLYEAQTGIKISGRNISNLRYAGKTTIVAEKEEESELKLPYNCTQLTHYLSNAQNSPGQASTVCEL